MAVFRRRGRRRKVSSRPARPARGAACPCSSRRHPASTRCAASAPMMALVRRGQLDRMQQERPRLRAAHAAVEGDQLLERAAFVELLVVEAVHHDVGDVGEAVGAQQVRRGRGRELRQRVLALHAALAQVVGAAGAQRHGAVLGRAHEQPADVRMGAERRQQVGVPLVDLLHRHAPRLVHQVDQPEVAGPHHDHLAVADVVLVLVLLLAARRLPHRLGDRRVVLVAGAEVLDAGAVQVALHQFVQPVAVALQEGGALRLAVVGEHDDLVGARGVLAGARDAPELLVELAQDLHGVRPLETRVVRHLVVAGEARVDRRHAHHHVADDAVHGEVAHEHREAGAHERVAERAVAARPDVAPALPRRRRPARGSPRRRRARRCGSRCSRRRGRPGSPGWPSSPPPCGSR